LSVGDSPELSGIQFTPPKRMRHGQDSLLCLAWWCELAFSFLPQRNIAIVDVRHYRLYIDQRSNKWPEYLDKVPHR